MVNSFRNVELAFTNALIHYATVCNSVKVQRKIRESADRDVERLKHTYTEQVDNLSEARKLILMLDNSAKFLHDTNVEDLKANIHQQVAALEAKRLETRELLQVAEQKQKPIDEKSTCLPEELRQAFQQLRKHASELHQGWLAIRELRSRPKRSIDRRLASRPKQMPSKIKELRDVVKNGQRIVIIEGAGVSKSGGSE